MEENPAVSPSFFQKLTGQKRMVIVGAGIVIALAYIGINIGIWTYASNSKKAAQTVSNNKSIVPENKQNGLPAAVPSTRGLTPTPAPRPTGPGPYACDPIGICNHYGDAQGKSCPKTYADNHCLDECGFKEVQCPQ